MFPPPPARSKAEPATPGQRHKDRSNWFRERAAYPFREADPNPLTQYRADRNARGPSPHPWHCLGPDNIGGRFTSLAIHPRRPDTIFAGAAGGGVWRSQNGGDTWKPLWSHQETLNVGALAIDPRNPDLIYCGTGEANLSGDSYPGAGLYVSTDGGDNWALLIPTSGNELFPSRIGSLAVKTRFHPGTDPPDTEAYVYLGSVTHADDDFSRLVGVRIFRGGQGISEFDQTFISDQNYWVHSVLMHPTGRLFVAVQARGTLSGIWRSDELGFNFQHLEKGLPAADRFGRVSLAFAPSKPEVLYALAENLQTRVLGVFRSDDLGESWRSVSQSHFRRESQASYNNCIAVDPENHRIVYCGLVNLHRSRNGGGTWERISTWRRKRGSKHYLHGDCHAIVIPRHKQVYVANDGGIFRSDDGGDSWHDLNHGLRATMFYDLDVAPSDGRVYGGGSQDNGVLIHTGGDASGSFQQALIGDGGWTVFDPDDPHHIWSSTERMRLQRFKNNAWKDVTPRHSSRAEKKEVWQSFLAMDSGRVQRRPRAVFAGSTRLWRTRSDGRAWLAVSRNLDNSVISAIEVASADARFVYVGTTNGGFFRSTDGGDTWSENLAGPDLPGRIITRIEAHPRNAQLVVLTVGQTPRARRVIVQLPAEGAGLAAASARFAHVFVSRDGGLNWAAGDLTGDGTRQLPDVPCNSLSFETRPPFRLFLAGDAGVFEGHVAEAPAPVAVMARARAGNEKADPIPWQDISGSLPNAPVTDIVYHEQTRSLFAATFGRGIWQLKIQD
jgi:photosystem II stability/assembly factor-like uncharacterized protein